MKSGAVGEDRRILLVEDTKAIAMMAKRLIEKNTGLPVDLAESLADAKTYMTIRAGKYELAILDLSLPDAPNGEIVELCQSKNLPSVIFSGTTDEDLRNELFGAGVIDYVIKDSFSAVLYLARLVKQLLINKRQVALFAGDAIDRAGFHVGLASRLQFSVRHASSLNRTLALIDENPDISIVFVGSDLGEDDGVQIIRKIRERHGRERVAIIGLPEEDRVMASRFIKNGADDYIIDPTTPEEFYCRVNAALETGQLLRDLDFAAHHDFLTACLNRRAFFEKCEGVHYEARKNDQSTLLAMVDIDHFKAVNDTYGHGVGDDVIAALGSYLRENCMEGGEVARFGGEEFCLMGPVADMQAATVWLNDVVAGVRELRVGEDGLGFRISAGGCLFDGKKLPVDALVNESDEQLYVSKEGGRDQANLSEYKAE